MRVIFLNIFKRHTYIIRLEYVYLRGILRDIRASLHKAGQTQCKAGQRDEYPKSGTVPPKSGRLTPVVTTLHLSDFCFLFFFLDSFFFLFFFSNFLFFLFLLCLLFLFFSSSLSLQEEQEKYISLIEFMY